MPVCLAMLGDTLRLLLLCIFRSCGSTVSTRQVHSRRYHRVRLALSDQHVRVQYVKKTKNVSCEYHRLNG